MTYELKFVKGEGNIGGGILVNFTFRFPLHACAILWKERRSVVELAPIHIAQHL